MMTSRCSLPFWLLLATITLVSCRPAERTPAAAGRPSPPPGAGGMASGAPSPELYVEVCALTQLPSFIDRRLGMEAAGRELGVKAEFVGPADYDMTAMIATLEQTLARKPAGGAGVRLRAALDAAAPQASRG